MSKNSFILRSRDEKRAVSFFSSLSADFTEIRFMLLESRSDEQLNKCLILDELKYSNILILTVRNEKSLDFVQVAYDFIEKGIIQMDGLSVISGL